MTTYSPAEAARIAGVVTSSIRNYCRDERFRAHFSASATPQPGKARQLTPNDLRVIRFIKQTTSAGATLDEAAARLRAGELDTFDWQPPEAATEQEPQQQQQSAALALAATLSQLETYQNREERYRDRETELHREIANLRHQVGQLEGELKALKRPFWHRLFGT